MLDCETGRNNQPLIHRLIFNKLLASKFQMSLFNNNFQLLYNDLAS